jgi:cytochrome c peroxidase
MSGVTQVLCGSALVVAAALGAACSAQPTTTSEASASSASALSAVKSGAHKFDHTFPTGNGRACATCHIESDEFALSPATVQARFQALQSGESDDDPLFRSVDADDPNCDDGHGDDGNDSHGDDGHGHGHGHQGATTACTYNHLLQGLVRVTLPLPANITVDELPGATEVSLWRAVPSLNNVALSAPYLSDGRADDPTDTSGDTLHLLPNANAMLQAQALGAAHAHIQIKKTPDTSFLDAIAVYELDQFSSAGVRDVAAQIAAGKTPKRAYSGTGTNVSPVSDGLLSDDELAGQQKFEFRCGACHGGNRTMDGFLSVGTKTHFHEVSVSLRNLVNLPVYTFRVSKPDATVVALRSPDPGRMLITGKVGNPCGPGCAGRDFEGFDVPPLYGIANTAPYFHDNSAATLDAVLDQYNFHFAKIKATGNKVPFVQTQMSTEEKRLIATYIARL